MSRPHSCPTTHPAAPALFMCTMSACLDRHNRNHAHTHCKEEKTDIAMTLTMRSRHTPHAPDTCPALQTCSPCSRHMPCDPLMCPSPSDTPAPSQCATAAPDAHRLSVHEGLSARTTPFVPAVSHRHARPCPVSHCHPLSQPHVVPALILPSIPALSI